VVSPAPPHIPGQPSSLSEPVRVDDARCANDSGAGGSPTSHRGRAWVGGVLRAILRRVGLPEDLASITVVKGFFRAGSEDSLRVRFARGTAWSFTGSVLSQGLSLAASAVTARLLGKAGFGQVAMIQTTVGTFGVFAGMGLGLTATKYVAEYRFTSPDRAGKIIALSNWTALISAAAVSGLLYAFAPELAARTLHAPELSSALRIGTVLLLFTALAGAQNGVLAGFGAFRALARINVIRGLLVLPVTAVAVTYWGLLGAISALALTMAAACVMGQFAVREVCRQNAIRVSWTHCWGERRVLWGFSLPAVLSGAMAGPATWAVSTFLVQQPQGYAQLGLFNAAYQWRNIIAFLPATVSQPVFVMLSHLAGIKASSTHKSFMRLNLYLNTGLGLAVAVPIIVMARWSMKVFGKDFSSAGPILVFLALATVISVAAAVVGQAIASMDRMWSGFLLNLIWALALGATSYLLVPAYGALGLAIAFLLSYSVHAATVTIFYRSMARGSFLKVRALPGSDE
jgi:O-antigen/teichoic acid export membrane protein